MMAALEENGRRAMEQGAMRNAIVSFFVGFLAAQAVWWFAAGETLNTSAADSAGAFSMRYVLLDVVEVLVASACFTFALAVAGRARGLRKAGGAVLLAFVAGATTSTLAAPPSALVPRLLAGDGQFFVDIVAAALVSAAFGWLVAAAFRNPFTAGTSAP
jgi:hypothetical protein